VRASEKRFFNDKEGPTCAQPLSPAYEFAVGCADGSVRLCKLEPGKAGVILSTLGAATPPLDGSSSGGSGVDTLPHHAKEVVRLECLPVSLLPQPCPCPGGGGGGGGNSSAKDSWEALFLQSYTYIVSIGACGTLRLWGLQYAPSPKSKDAAAATPHYSSGRRHHQAPGTELSDFVIFKAFAAEDGIGSGGKMSDLVDAHLSPTTGLLVTCASDFTMSVWDVRATLRKALLEVLSEHDGEGGNTLRDSLSNSGSGSSLQNGSPKAGSPKASGGSPKAHHHSRKRKSVSIRRQSSFGVPQTSAAVVDHNLDPFILLSRCKCLLSKKSGPTRSFLPSFSFLHLFMHLPSFLPSFLFFPSFIFRPSFLPSVLPSTSFFPSFLPSFLQLTFFLSSVLPSTSLLPS
jgi:hypothetical protein